MIERLQLRNWRAYDQLDLELGTGATFIVASNGVGKTSLIMAGSWALFGDASGIQAADEIRGDAETASVTVDLRLPTKGRATIARSIDRAGRASLSVRVGDREIASQVELDSLLAAEFGADPHVLTQLVFMLHGGLETRAEFTLQDHLAKVFGVTPLFEAASQAKAMATEVGAALRRIKTVQRKDRRQREQLVAELRQIDEAVAAIQARRDEASRAVAASSSLLAQAKEWTRYRKSEKERLEQLENLAREAVALLGRQIATSDVVRSLEDAEERSEDDARSAEATLAGARAKTELIQQAIAGLNSADATCPTCLRPLSEHESEAARGEHEATLTALSAVTENAKRQADELRTKVRQVRALLTKVRTVPAPVPPDSEEVLSLGQVETEDEVVRSRLRTLDLEHAEAMTLRRNSQDALSLLDEEEKQFKELRILYRREAIATAAAKTFQSTGEAITQQFIEPLVADVARRWKLIFGSGGLNLSSSGRITRRVGSRELPFESLSGGEKVWALLLTRLLISGASTRAPFVWLDEPLEHLDPRLRKVVAGTLAMASSGVGLRQVIVTTYEAQLAQQLMEDVPSASLIFVTSSD